VAGSFHVEIVEIISCTELLDIVSNISTSLQGLLFILLYMEAPLTPKHPRPH
jgi:DNA-binding GntR family transcriptional regulator